MEGFILLKYKVSQNNYEYYLGFPERRGCFTQPSVLLPRFLIERSEIRNLERVWSPALRAAGQAQRGFANLETAANPFCGGSETA